MQPTPPPSSSARRQRSHPAQRARLITGVASVAATLGLSGFLAATFATPTTIVASTATQATTQATTTPTTQVSRSFNQSTTAAAVPATVASQAQTSSSGS